MHYRSTDAGALIAARYAVAGVDLTAGASASDGVEINGAWIDRQGFLSLKIVIVFRAVLGQDETLKIAANAQDATASNGTGAADFGTAYASTTVATGGAGGSTETGVVEMDLDLTAADRYVRVQLTPNLSRANTDTAEISAVYLLAGADVEPVSASVI